MLSVTWCRGGGDDGFVSCSGFPKEMDGTGAATRSSSHVAAGSFSSQDSLSEER